VSEAVEITVHGSPEPGGSKTAWPLPNRHYRKGQPAAMRFLHASDGRPIINVADANEKKVKPWRKAVGAACSEQYRGALLDGPLLVEMTFFVHRPASHYGTGANARKLKPSAPCYPTVRPDALKLARPVEDALTGILWTDDARTVDLVAHKRYVEGYCVEGMPGPRVEIKVLEHAHQTMGERAEAAQGSLLSAA
jgi:Holliday junction resolvase RusA-like endonuclease